jgi:hypothetical protein
VFRAMAMKELRETRGIALLTLAAYFLLVATLASPWGARMRYIWPPFTSDGAWYGWFISISGAMAMILGLRQTLGESIPGVYPFLLHRPAGRCWLIGVKLFVGLTLYLLCAVLPILAYGIWAATPGTHPDPFEWSMTMPTWNFWFGMTLVYLGAFLAGIRPGRWYRSRILPLAAGPFLLTILMVPAFQFALAESLWPCLIILALDAWMIAMILFVVRTRDYP